jgi:hypothetical protein
VTEEEISRAPAALRTKLVQALRSLQPQLLRIDPEARGLAQLLEPFQEQQPQTPHWRG